MEGRALKKALEGVGLSQVAIRVYLTLIRIGTANINQISQNSKMHPQSVKNGLTTLVKHGLATQMNYRMARSLWRAVSPDIIEQRLDRISSDFRKVLPILSEEYRQHPNHFLQISTGTIPAFANYQSLVQEASPGTDTFIFNVVRERVTETDSAAYSSSEMIRVKKNIRKLMLVGQKTEKRLRQFPFMATTPKTEIRLSSVADGRFTIMGNYQRVIFMFWDITEPIVISVADTRYVKQVKAMFDLIWNQAHPITF